MARLINETQVRKAILSYCDKAGPWMQNKAPNEQRRESWGSLDGEPKLYNQISPDVLKEIDGKVRLIVQEVVDRNRAGMRGQTIL